MTTEVSMWLDRRLQSVVKRIPFVACSSIDVINRLENIQFKQECILVTADIVSLYTNIRLDEAAHRIYNILQEIGEGRIASAIVDLIMWVMTNNYFTFQNNYYHQTCGTAMGCNVAPVFANLFVADAESYVLGDGRCIVPRLYIRYLDDVFFVWEGSRQHLERFKERLNQMSPSLAFTFTESQSEIPYLDLLIKKGGRFTRTGILDLECYRKPENPLLYTHATSYQPNHAKYNWISAECIRLTRNCSDIIRYTFHRNLFRQSLSKRGYPPSEIKRQFDKIDYDKRLEYLKIEEETDDTDDLVTVRLRNTPGRHIISKYIRKLFWLGTAASNVQTPTQRLRIVVLKGRTLLSKVNGVNQLLLKRPPNGQSAGSNGTTG